MTEDDLEPEPANEAFGVKGGDDLWRLILEAFIRAAENDPQ